MPFTFCIADNSEHLDNLRRLVISRWIVLSLTALLVMLAPALLDLPLPQWPMLDIIIATGREDRLTPSSREMSGILWNKGIGNALREWDGWAHDWPYWQQMITQYVSGHD